MHLLHALTCDCHRLDQARVTSGARELFTRRDTGQHCSTSFAAGFRSSRPAAPVSHASNCSGSRITGIRSFSSPTNSLVSVMIIARDLIVSPACRSRHSSHKPAMVIAAPSRRVK